MKRKTARKILKWAEFTYLMLFISMSLVSGVLFVLMAVADSGYWGLFLWVCLFALGGVFLGVCNVVVEDVENWLKERANE